MGTLAPSRVTNPWFGPRVFDEATACPAKAAIALRGWAPAAGLVRPPKGPFAGAWPASADLLRELASRGPTSLWVAGRHPAQDLYRLADAVLPQSPPPVRQYAAATIETLLEAQAETGDRFDYHPDFLKVPFASGQVHSGGVFVFRRPDGAAQGWRLRVGSAHQPADEASRGWALTAAYVLAWHYAVGDQVAGPVEVYELGATDGVTVPLGQWTNAAEVGDAFRALAEDRLATMASTLDTSPGPHCVECGFLHACPSTAVVTGLLDGVGGRRVALKVTATALNTFARCPHRYFLSHVQGLPAEDLGPSEPMRRGLVVDQWLTRRHGTGRPCDASDLTDLRDPLADPVVRAMATRHLDACPLAQDGVSNARCQPDVVAVDEATSIVVLARPDLRFERNGRVIWRETKTRSQLTTRDALALVESDIAAALYLAVLASGADGRGEALEWEELTGGQLEITVLPSDDDALVEAARRTLSSAIADLLAENVYSPRPGSQCAACPVRARCFAAP